MTINPEREREIAALEREACYELNSFEVRYIAEVKAHLLRHGYRFQPAEDDPRILTIVHLASGKAVYITTQNELRYARLGKDGWLRTVRYGHYYIVGAEQEQA